MDVAALVEAERVVGDTTHSHLKRPSIAGLGNEPRAEVTDDLREAKRVRMSGLGGKGEGSDAQSTARKTRVVSVKVDSLRSRACECCDRSYASLAAWMQHSNHVYVGRKVAYVPSTFDSDWRNPFPVCKIQTREQSLQRFKNYLSPEGRGSTLPGRARRELRGKTLGCWCFPELCHADILREIADAEPVAVVACSEEEGRTS